MIYATFANSPLWEQIAVVLGALFIVGYGIAFVVNFARLIGGNPLEDRVQTPQPKFGPPAAFTDGLTASDDPLNIQPKAIQPILYADGYRLTPEDLHKQGLCYLINSDGRIVSVMKLNGASQPTTWTVEECVGFEHGARIS